jgi:demethoxyubiquinone hydroxylase (CLK1/Coq7/Cat5 family)
MNRYGGNQKKDDEFWQKRHFLLSSVVRIGKPISPLIYEFIDHLINQNYEAPLNSLFDVDKEVSQLLKEYEDRCMGM